MFRPEPPADMSAWAAVMSGNGASSGFGDDWLKFAGIKIFYDGGMTLRTALTRDVYPDSHDDYHGIAQQTPERLKQLVSICNRYNWRVGVHVVGVLIGVGSRRRSASQAIDLSSNERVNVGRLFTP